MFLVMRRLLQDIEILETDILRKLQVKNQYMIPVIGRKSDRSQFTEMSRYTKQNTIITLK